MRIFHASLIITTLVIYTDARPSYRLRGGGAHRHSSSSHLNRYAADANADAPSSSTTLVDESTDTLPNTLMTVSYQRQQYEVMNDEEQKNEREMISLSALMSKTSSLVPVEERDVDMSPGNPQQQASQQQQNEVQSRPSQQQQMMMNQQQTQQQLPQQVQGNKEATQQKKQNGRKKGREKNATKNGEDV